MSHINFDIAVEWYDDHPEIHSILTFEEYLEELENSYQQEHEDEKEN